MINYINGSAALLIIIISGLLDCFYATTNYLLTLSVVLTFQIILFNFKKNDKFFIDPLFIFSLIYFGYAVGGIYYSFSNGQFGKFLGFLNLDRHVTEQYLVYALIYANVCYFAIATGYRLFVRANNFYVPEIESTIASYLINGGGVPIFLMILSGFAYWIWVSNVIAGGVINSLILFQVFPHLVAEHKISIAPYLIYYAGINIWLLKLILKGSNINIPFIFFSILGFIISASTARISITLTYAFGQLYLIYMVHPQSRKSIHRIFLTIICIGLGLFFLRDISNHLFLNDGGGLEGLELNFFESIVGGGNVSDLQQLVIIFKTFNLNEILFGLSYFDWLNNSLSNVLDLKPTSVGLRVANLYVPDTSGAPTPGAIGEAFANFHILAPLFMFFFGASMALLKNLIDRKNSVILYFTYSCFLTSFIFLYPKVDSTMIANFFWNAFPTVFILLSLSLIFKLISFSSFPKAKKFS